MSFSKIFLGVVSAVFALSSVGALAKAVGHKPRLDLEMTGAEYRQLLHKKTSVRFFEAMDAEDVALVQYLKYGERNLQWVDLINQSRTADTRISLTSAATANGFPINSPRRLNFNGIEQQWAVLLALMPQALKSVIFDGAAMPAQPPVSDREFIEWLRQVDDAYQISARYKMMKPWKADMAAGAAQDVRGYLLLRDDAQADQTLAQYQSFSAEKKNLYSEALVQICRNAQVTDETCRAELAAHLTDNSLVDFKNKYFAAAEQNYNSFFQIPFGRKDLSWQSSDTSSVLLAPFANPHNDRVLDYLKTNIEDEWHWGDWKLELNFIETSSPDTTHVVFEAGATPHVNDIAGSEITMDANGLLSEYDVQWTIRHEYGHVLGFPDCYIEFYEEATDTIIAYQLDITNLMCSRRGHIQQKHFDELKRVYGASLPVK